MPYIVPRGHITEIMLLVDYQCSPLQQARKKMELLYLELGPYSQGRIFGELARLELWGNGGCLFISEVEDGRKAKGIDR